jgi:hypothetical protein
MDAGESTPATGESVTDESSDTDSTKEIYDGGVDRRQFMSVFGGLALLAGASDVGAGQDYEPEIEQKQGSIKADCGSVTTPGPIAEMFAIPDNGEIRVQGYRATDTDEHSVQMDICTGSSQPSLSMKQILTPEQARDLAARLEDAAAVAAGEVETDQ